MFLFRLALTAVISYLLGCFNGSIIISKYILKDDIRNHGSGNAGLTNFYRTFHGPLTFLVILGDVLKVVVAVLLAKTLLVPFGWGVEGGLWSGFFVMLGHVFPIFFRFKGGKGVLSAGTLAAMMDWRVFALTMGIFILSVALTQWVSLGSVLAGFCFPFAVWYLMKPSAVSIVLAFLCGLLLLIMHRENIGRLLRGEERKFHLSKK
ncbi:MAG: glycerol-3-phosphate 1-O-acyltransferase PlsY [Oscillospiraceae bacterium]|nr:glycerol-3-phosphate 1-O-acyltransferase PlsY [Oscillospiraceae bacterium]